MSNIKFFCINFFQELYILSILFLLITKEFQNKVLKNWLIFSLPPKSLDISIILFFIFYNMQLLDFNKRFVKSYITIYSKNLDDKLSNKNIFKLLSLLLIALVLSINSLNRSKIAFYS